jgi:hypothetical protein
MRNRKHRSQRSLSITFAAIFAVGLVACKREDSKATAATDPAPSATPVGSANPNATTNAATALTPTECIAAPDYLVPPTKYGDSDLIRAIATEGTDVVFGNMTSIFRVPTSGGTPQEIGKAPGTTLRGQYDLWISGEKLLTQSPGESIFMEMPRAGGSWTTFANLSADQAPGGRDAATRVLQNLHKGSAKIRAGAADFDGTTFYWTEESTMRGVPGNGRVLALSLSGGDAKTLYEAPGSMDGLVRAGEHVVFVHTAPPSAEALAAYKSSKKQGLEPKGRQTLVAVPRSGGSAVPLGRITQWMSRTSLVADGEEVYVSGYEGGDLTKPGVFRVNAGGGAWERVDPRVVTGRGVVYPGGVAVSGSSFLEVGKLASGQVVLAGAKGGPLTQVACFTQRFTSHAWAVTGKTLLVSLFESDTRLASIVRIALP